MLILELSVLMTYIFSVMSSHIFLKNNTFSDYCDLCNKDDDISYMIFTCIVVKMYGKMPAIFSNVN